MTRSEAARLIFTVIGIQAFEDLFSSLSIGVWYLYFAIVTLWFWRSSHRLPLWFLGAGAVGAMGHCTVELAGLAERSDNLLFAFGYVVTVFIAIAAEAGEPDPA
jgi:hypothetical protein